MDENQKSSLPWPGTLGRLEDEKVRDRLSFVFQIAVPVVFGALVAITMFRMVTMQESSMEPTIRVGNRYFVNQLAYRFGELERGDIIVFKTNGEDDAALHISRVIGLPGETIRITNGRIYINEELYSESGVFPVISNPGLAGPGIDLEAEEYFVLGDNRNNSEDSRYSDIGKVKKRYVIGKIWFQVYPLSEMMFV